MNRHQCFSFLAPAALCSTALAGCTQETGEARSSFGTVEQAIVGGAPATGEKYRAVGSLVRLDDGELIPYCTATLAGPTEVLTARHCTGWIQSAPSTGIPVFFAVGDDPLQAEQYIPVTGHVSAEPSKGTFQGLLVDGGRDIAVAYLDSSPVDVLPVQIGVFERWMLGTQFELAGFGYNGIDHGTRFAGLSTARSLTGLWYSLLFDGDHKAYLDWYYTDAATFYPNKDEANIWWSLYKLEPNYELFVGGLDGDALGCFGDSGGPMLLGDSAEDLTIYGVGFATESSKSQVCALGNAFVPFYNKDIKEFVASALGL